MAIRVADLVAEAMKRAGTKQLFGLAGSSMLPVLDSVTQRTDIRYISVRHEQSAASMAEGVSRTTGAPGVFITQSGPAVLNTAMAVASAFKDSVPLVALSTTEPQQMMGRESWHEIDTFQVFKPIVKWSAKVVQPEQAARVLRNAFQIAVSGRPGPVQVELAENISAEQVDETLLDELGNLSYTEDGPMRTPRFRPAPDLSLIEKAVDMLGEAEKPLIYLGGGAVWSDASDELVAMVEAIGAPVITTYCGRGAIPDSHPQNISYVVRGHLARWLGGYIAFEAMRDSDVILAIGARFSDISTRNWTAVAPGTKIIQVDISDQQIGLQYPVSVGIEADARQFAKVLTKAWQVEGKNSQRFRDRSLELGEAYEQERAQYFQYDREAKKIQAQQVIEELQPLVDKDTILVLGSGRHTHHSNKLWIEQPHMYINSVSLGTMGQAFPAAIGAKLANPDRKVVCLTGDGDYAMVMEELETAVRESVHVSTIIFNDFGYGAVKMWQAAAFGGRVAGVDHGNPNFGAVAELFGARGYTVDEPRKLGELLKQVLSSDGPSVLDIRVDRATYQVK